MATERKKIDDMNKEMRDLKKYHLEEISKLEDQHKLKYKQLKQMMDEYRL